MVITSSIKATFPCNLQRVWDTVTSLSDYSWRSDIERIEVISDTQFVEITKGGSQTTFTIIKQEPYRLWEFNMENEIIKGHWIGVFCGDKKSTTINFTEYIKLKKWFPSMFVKIYLKMQQRKYVRDLRGVLKIYSHRIHLNS